MCGRYALAAGTEALIEAFDLPAPVLDFVPRYNIAPGQLAPVVAADRSGRRMGLMTWGLVPRWAREPRPGLINARVESVGERASFGEAFERRRCLVPASGFFEWKGEGGRKTPFWIRPVGGEVIAFAGIWERWGPPGEEPKHTFAILTTAASGDVASLHDRMPLIVSRTDRDAWLDRGVGGAEVLARMRGTEAPALTFWQVAPRVGSPREDDPALFQPAGGS